MEGVVKLTVDKSSRGNPKTAGFACVRKGKNSRWSVRIKGSIGSVGNLLLDLMAVRHGLKLAWQEGDWYILRMKKLIFSWQ